MTTTWIVIALVAALTALFRGAGTVLLGDRELPSRLVAVFACLPVPLLASLVVVETVTSGRHLVLDARLAGLAAALVAVALRARLVVVIALAAATTAGVRALG
ncbi:MAG: AzlD domain-containing protein [Actinobacteria bacterium]|nr:AzlD domain-containing protein [Actinomycetota bacterium]